MAISAVTLGQVFDTGNSSTYGVALTRAPADNTLVLVDIVNCDTAPTVSLPSSVSGAGLVFSLVTSAISYNPFTAGSQTEILSTWRAMGTGLNNSRISCAGMGSGNNTGCAMIVTEYSGVSTSGSNGANAVGQDSNDSQVAATTFDQASGPTSATSTANGWHNALARASSTADMTPDRGFVLLGSGAFATPSTALFSAFTTNSSATTCQWTGTSAQGVSNFIELVADNPATPPAGGVIDTWYYRQARQGVYFA